MKKIPILITLSLAASGLFAQTQHSFSSSSRSATINGVQYDYTIGEMTLISTEKNANLIVTQGFLQPNSSGSVTHNTTSDNNLSNFASLIKVYPNPTENILFIDATETLQGTFDFQLMDVSGKVIMDKKSAQTLASQKWNLNLSTLAAGSYFLLMNQTDLQGKSQITSFKIQKTK